MTAQQSVLASFVHSSAPEAEQAILASMALDRNGIPAVCGPTQGMRRREAADGGAP